MNASRIPARSSTGIGEGGGSPLWMDGIDGQIGRVVEYISVRWGGVAGGEECCDERGGGEVGHGVLHGLRPAAMPESKTLQHKA